MPPHTVRCACLQIFPCARLCLLLMSLCRAWTTETFEWRLASFGNRSTREVCLSGERWHSRPPSCKCRLGAQRKGRRTSARSRKSRVASVSHGCSAGPRSCESLSVGPGDLAVIYPDYILFSLGHTGHPWAHSPR